MRGRKPRDRDWTCTCPQVRRLPGGPRRVPTGSGPSVPPVGPESRGRGVMNMRVSQAINVALENIPPPRLGMFAPDVGGGTPDRRVFPNRNTLGESSWISRILPGVFSSAHVSHAPQGLPVPSVERGRYCVRDVAAMIATQTHIKTTSVSGLAIISVHLSFLEPAPAPAPLDG